MDMSTNKSLWDIFDLDEKSIGRLEMVQASDECCARHQMEYYISESNSFPHENGILLAADSSGFVCDLFQPERNDGSLQGCHNEYTLLQKRYDTEKEARDVCDSCDVAGLESYDVVFVEKENKWALLHCDLYPNLVKASAYLQVEFNEEFDGSHIFFCEFQCETPHTPRGYIHLGRILNKS